MSPDAVLQYLSSLLNKSIGPSDTIKLSSAQKSRFIGWLDGQGVSIEPGSLSAVMEVAALISALTGSAVPVDTPKSIAPRSGSMSLSSLVAVGQRGVGIDIQSVSELVPTAVLNDLKSAADLRAIFSLRELSYAQSQPNPGETLTGIFAAKEAIRKADPDQLRREMIDIEVLPGEDGAPGFAGFAISISHSAGMAVAIALRVAEVGAAATASSPGPGLPGVPAASAPPQPTRRVIPVGIGLVVAMIFAGAVGFALGGVLR